MKYPATNRIAALAVASCFVFSVAAAADFQLAPKELINRPAAQVEELASMTICFGAVRDNYVEPDSDYSCSAML